VQPKKIIKGRNSVVIFTWSGTWIFHSKLWNCSICKQNHF